MNDDICFDKSVFTCHQVKGDAATQRRNARAPSWLAFPNIFNILNIIQHIQRIQQHLVLLKICWLLQVGMDAIG